VRHVYRLCAKQTNLSSVGATRVPPGTHVAPTGLGVGPIQSYKHFAPTAHLLGAPNAYQPIAEALSYFPKNFLKDFGAARVFPS
jgi:hypothetical protein